MHVASTTSLSIVSRTSSNSAPDGRPALRRQLLARRELHATGEQASAADASMARHLNSVLTQLEPQCLGLYWPIRCEFNPRLALSVDYGHSNARPDSWPAVALALPYCRREPRAMHYRRWDGGEPALRDECGIPTPERSSPVVPDVVLVPCLGFTRSGYRLGYGGGYFDRWLAAHAHVTSIGVAWTASEIDDASFAAQAHDQPLTLIVTEQGVVTG
jgi:5-formyltetrahydrofolate cyclo-ligase